MSKTDAILKLIVYVLMLPIFAVGMFAGFVKFGFTAGVEFFDSIIY